MLAFGSLTSDEKAAVAAVTSAACEEVYVIRPPYINS